MGTLSDWSKGLVALITAIVVIAIIAVIVGRNSTAPKVIQAGFSGLGNVVAAAVNPVNNSAQNGNLGANAYTSSVSSI
jgi:cell shape-determining protein MreC